MFLSILIAFDSKVNFLKPFRHKKVVSNKYTMVFPVRRDISIFNSM